MQALSSCKSSGIRGGALTAGPRRSAVASASRALTTRINATVTIPKKYSTVTPVGDRVYVKLGAEEQTTASGILLPSSAVARSNEGQVVAAGKDAKLSVGAQVMFGKYSGTEVEVAEESYMLLKEADIIGTMPSSNVADLQPTGTRILVKVSPSCGLPNNSQDAALVPGLQCNLACALGYARSRAMLSCKQPAVMFIGEMTAVSPPPHVLSISPTA